MSNSPEHRLWAAVLAQAFEDLRGEEFGSYDYNQAAAFFFSSEATWVEGRREICDFLGMEPSQLRRPALRIANARRLEAGLPPLQTRAPTPCVPKQRAAEPTAAVRALQPLPRLVATFNPPEEPKPRRRPDNGWRNRWHYNPFDPFRRLPSEERAAQTGD